jgi:glycosyltransferase 2 family protein
MTPRTLPQIPERWRPPRWAVGLVALAVAVTVPLLTLPTLPQVAWLPVLLGLAPWVVGKYVLCPLRWHALSESGRPRRWHLRAYAESELMGLFTPGHVGADLWRVRRLNGIGMQGSSAVAEVALDRFVGALGLSAFVLVAGAALPTRMLLTAFGLAAGVLLAVVLLKRLRPELVPQRRLPRPSRLTHGVLLSMCYQLSICALLLGVVAATGHTLSPLALLGAFGASQLAGAVPGPHGASPRDGALVVALMALGLPWQAALGAVSLKAALAWLPALLLGGISLVLARRAGAHLRTSAAMA